MSNKTRLYDIYKLASWDRVLELGPYNGYDTVKLAQHAKRVVCLEGREENIRRTLKTLEKCHCEAEVIGGDLETFDLSSLGKFDVVWASGVLYHMPNPVELIAQIAQVTSRCLGWSHLANKPDGKRHGYVGMEKPEQVDQPLSGMSEQSWLLTPREFARAWREHGWHFDFLTYPEPTPHWGLEAQFVAWIADFN
jgi:SAM-dependent methyltransferase